MEAPTKGSRGLSRTIAGFVGGAIVALIVAASILVTLFVAKFSQGAWVAVLVALVLAACGWWVRSS